jgi:hypothetical protein
LYVNDEEKSFITPNLVESVINGEVNNCLSGLQADVGSLGTRVLKGGIRIQANLW